MTKNMGMADRAVRFLIVVGIAVAYATGLLSGGWTIGLGVLASAFLLTSFIGTCPGYMPFGISTRGRG